MYAIDSVGKKLFERDGIRQIRHEGDGYDTCSQRSTQRCILPRSIAQGEIGNKTRCNVEGTTQFEYQ